MQTHHALTMCVSLNFLVPHLLGTRVREFEYCMYINVNGDVSKF